MIQNYVALNTAFKKVSEKQPTFRSASGKDKQLHSMLIDKISRRYCTDEANNMIHLGTDHRSVTAHFRFSCVKKERRIDKKDRKQHLYQNTRYKIQETNCINGNTRRSHTIRKP